MRVNATNEPEDDVRYDEDDGEPIEGEAETVEEAGEEATEEESVADRPVASEPDEDGYVSFDLAPWSHESRTLIASMLDSNEVAHAWQGTTVSVEQHHLDEMELLIDETLASTRHSLDPALSRNVYEVGSWSAAMQTGLAEALTVAEIPYEWDERGDLVVYSSDEEAVEAIFDAMPDPDDPDAVDADGVDVQSALSRLWASSRTLAKKPQDASAILEAIEASDQLESFAVPFGFESIEWHRLVRKSGDLRRALEEPDEDAQLSDEQLQELASEIAGKLRKLV